MGVRDDLFPQEPYLQTLSTDALERGLERLKKYGWGEQHFERLSHEIQAKIAKKEGRRDKAKEALDAIRADRDRARHEQDLSRPMGSSSSSARISAGLALMFGGGPLTRTHAKQIYRGHQSSVMRATRLMGELRALARERGITL